MVPPKTRWARSGELNIAYQAFGDGPIDMVFISALLSHVEHLWEDPPTARFLERCGRFARLIMLDRRGTGMSDPAPGDFSPEEELEDLTAVLDAVGSQRAALLAYGPGGPFACLYTARRPERVGALVLYGAMARAVGDEEMPWAERPEERLARLEGLLARWGEGTNVEVLAPSRAGDEQLRAWFARMERLAASPGTAQRLQRNFQAFDVREALPAINVPTLVLHRTDDRLIDVRHSRYLAQRIPGARLVELPGEDSLPSAGDTDALLGEVEEFLTGVRHADPGQRVLRTVLFTDIVAGTQRAAQLGDARWRDLLDAHHAVVRRELERFDGQEVKTTGDGFLAVFSGPPSQAVRCAQATVAAAEPLGLRLRAGLHLGECELTGDDVAGMAVHVAARVVGLAGPGEVVATSTVHDAALGAGLAFTPDGEHELRGVPGRWRLFLAVT